MFRNTDLFILKVAQFFVNAVYDWIGIQKYFFAGMVWFFGFGVSRLVFWKFGDGVFSVGELLIGTVGVSLVWLLLFLIGQTFASILKRGESQDGEVLDHDSESIVEFCEGARCLWLFMGVFVYFTAAVLLYISPKYVLAPMVGAVTVTWCSFIFYIFSCSTPPRGKSKVRKFLELLKPIATPAMKPAPAPVPI